MKLPLSVGALAMVGLTLASVSSVACAPRARHRKWRNPASPAQRAACVRDSDCDAGLKCAIEIGAMQGVCNHADPSSAPPASGDEPSSTPPEPTIQPSSDDIRI